jgi:hypothetical protein
VGWAGQEEEERCIELVISNVAWKLIACLIVLLAVSAHAQGNATLSISL